MSRSGYEVENWLQDPLTTPVGVVIIYLEEVNKKKKGGGERWR